MYAFNNDRFNYSTPPPRTCYVVAVAGKIKQLKYYLFESLLVGLYLYPIFPTDSLTALTAITVKYIFIIMPRLSCFSVSIFNYCFVFIWS